MTQIRERFTYANVMATMAVFIALGGGAYAASVAKNSVTSKAVKDNSLKGKDVKAETLTSADIDESTLKLTCPAGTLNAGGTCMESTTRAPAGLEAAMNACAAANRRLPTPSEYRTLTALPGITINGNGEQTTVYPSTSTNIIATENGLSLSNDASFARPFRCATSPGS